MYEIITYKNKDGEDKITEYITELGKKAQTSKEHRVKVKKVIQYLDLLRVHGTMVCLPAVKHIEDKLWELRPTDDRIFFFYWQDNTFVLLHHFKKQTQKTPPREIEQANKNMKDFIERSNKHE
ncbi:MAG: type II toxin-antitoxin system RelE/ParE family toxin [Clostridiaceae bacterium]|nr:type II toxin-antitoxin system RelE/ParE family toxin [Clostridiaceae bacterium]